LRVERQRENLVLGARLRTERERRRGDETLIADDADTSRRFADEEPAIRREREIARRMQAFGNDFDEDRRRSERARR
jgi:hypothetical protein